VYFMALLSVFVLLSLVTFYGHSANFGFVWYIFSRFGMLHKEKSGNTVCLPKTMPWKNSKKSIMHVWFTSE
jgi:hypothetical protein